MKRQGIVVHTCSIISGLAIASVFITSPPEQSAYASDGLRPDWFNIKNEWRYKIHASALFSRDIGS